MDVELCQLENRPGALLECIATVAQQNKDTGKRIRDVAIGVPGDDGLVPVQVYSEEAEFE